MNEDSRVSSLRKRLGLAGRLRRFFVRESSFRGRRIEAEAIRHRTIGCYTIGHSICQRELEQIEVFAVEKGVTLIDEIQDRPDDDRDQCRSPRYALGEAQAEYSRPLRQHELPLRSAANGRARQGRAPPSYGLSRGLPMHPSSRKWDRRCGERPIIEIISNLWTSATSPPEWEYSTQNQSTTAPSGPMA